MYGGAFTIGDALVAIRWAEQIQSRGYRVVITPRYQNSDEVIEVYIPNTTKPTFMVYHDASSVRIADCIGLTLSFPTLTNALLAMVPLPKSGRRKMLRGGSPAWLPGVAGKSTQGVDNLWAWAGRSVYASLRFRLASIVGSGKRRKTDV